MINQEKVLDFTRLVSSYIDVMNYQLSDDNLESLMRGLVPKGLVLSEKEFQKAVKTIASNYQIKTNPGEVILNNYDQEDWYVPEQLDGYFWGRYRNYLIDKKDFSPNVVKELGTDTLDLQLMNCLANPNGNYKEQIIKRGLVIGDVQSGKTSTYIGLMCKAADAGYKVFILLTGVTESLRRQTQERVEEGFIGINIIDNKRVGVGLDNGPIKASSVTSRENDFTGNAGNVTLAMDDNITLFVIKKQAKVLNKLEKWLRTFSKEGKLNYPMLMIDDEADNASINTKTKDNPTTINKEIRRIASMFMISNYVGFTATPFANVFIDPETDESMETQDLFPEDFIVTLPTPSNYIGANEIFSMDGKYHSQLRYINDAGVDVEDGYSFYFKHDKYWDDDLPNSLTDAIYVFYLANAIRDLNGDIRTDRSMVVNMSRFTNVQKCIKMKVEDIHKHAYFSVKDNLCKDLKETLRDPILNRIHVLWEENYKNERSWEDISKVLLSSIEDIEIKVVNSSKNSDKLVYDKSNPKRVIAIGGLALSRGLTLEGLIVSYFYRNTCTYDVLMQMARWFGYRKGYETLFRIWIDESTAEWYEEIAEATDQLKRDMVKMRESHKKPKEFGIRVRNDSKELRITAANKMRNSKDFVETFSYFGNIVETPYAKFDANVIKNNYEATLRFVKNLIDVDGLEFKRQNPCIGASRYLIQDISKERIIEYLKAYDASDYNEKFDTNQIIKFLENVNDDSLDKFDLAFMEGDKSDKNQIIDICGREISKVLRSCKINGDRLSFGYRGKLGGTRDGLAGIIDFHGIKAADIVEEAKERYRCYYEKNKSVKFDKDSYPSETWFAFVKERKPLLIIYPIGLKLDRNNGQYERVKEFNEKLGNTPVIGLAMGVPYNDQIKLGKAVQYKVNKKYDYSKNILEEGEEE